MIGKNITAPNDRLYPIEIKELYNTIVNPEDALQSIIQQLRIIQGIDGKRYQSQKLSLPYFVCANYHPPYRHDTHVGNIEYFLIEIDQLSAKNLSPRTLKDRLARHAQVLMIFTSIGQNGIKIMYRLQDPCYDPTKFEIFYHHFANRLFRQLNVEQIINPLQSSPTQSSFLTYDPEAIFNSQAQPVDMDNYVDFSDFLAVEKLKTQIREDKQQAKHRTVHPVRAQLTDESIIHIKQKLGIRTRSRQKSVHPLANTLPQKLNDITQKLQSFDLIVEKISTIPYGRSITVSNHQGHRVTMHIFFKPDGYNIVRSISDNVINSDLADIVYKVLYQHLCCRN